MARTCLALLVLAACSGPSKQPVDPAPIAPDAAPPAPDAGPTPAELAVAAHRDRMLDQRGVVNLRVDDTGTGVIVDLCAAEAAAGLDLSGFDVPVATLPGDWGATARGEPCGCVDEDGKYYRDGEGIPVDCNTCSCEAGRLGRCTLLGCEIVILDRVYFDKNATAFDGNDKQLLDAVAAALIANPRVRISIVGHGHKKEKKVKALSLQRAEAVLAYLANAGVPAAQLLGATGVGDTQPSGRKQPEAERNVEFVVAQE